MVLWFDDVVSSALERRSPCGCTSLGRGCPGSLGVQPQQVLDRVGPTALSSWITEQYTLSWLKCKKVAANLPVCQLGSLFERARMTTCRTMFLCLFHASVSFWSSFPKSKTRFFATSLHLLPGNNSIHAFEFLECLKQVVIDMHVCHMYKGRSHVISSKTNYSPLVGTREKKPCMSKLLLVSLILYSY